MEIVVEKKINIPTQVIGNLLLIAARGFRNEDPHNKVVMDVEEFELFSRIVKRGLIGHEDDPMKAWCEDELDNFWKELEHDDPAPSLTG
jgi:hypothetical protein